MTTTTETGGPAFPQPNMIDDGELIKTGDTGMTLRDYFAAKAMLGFITNDNLLREAAHYLPEGSEYSIARLAYDQADAMLRERGEQEE